MKKRFLSMLCVLTMSSVLFSGFSAYASNSYGEYEETSIESLYAKNSPGEDTYSAASTRAEGWHQDSTGWWYEKGDGSYARNEWLLINNYWYYFNNDGYMLSGWQYINNKWYYLNPGEQPGYPQGAMVTGTCTIKSDTYGNNTFGFRSSGELYYTKLGVERVDEKEDEWCWIGSIKTIGDYLNPDNGISQNDICLYVKGTIVNSGGNSDEEKKGLSYITGLDAEAYYPLSMTSTVNKLMNYTPFLASMHYINAEGKEKGHAITAIGYNEDEGRIFYLDADKRNTSTGNSFNLDEAMNGTFLYPGTTTGMKYSHAVVTN